MNQDRANTPVPSIFKSPKHKTPPQQLMSTRKDAKRKLRNLQVKLAQQLDQAKSDQLAANQLELYYLQVPRAESELTVQESCGLCSLRKTAVLHPQRVQECKRCFTLYHHFCLSQIYKKLHWDQHFEIGKFVPIDSFLCFSCRFEECDKLSLFVGASNLLMPADYLSPGKKLECSFELTQDLYRIITRPHSPLQIQLRSIQIQTETLFPDPELDCTKRVQNRLPTAYSFSSKDQRIKKDNSAKRSENYCDKPIVFKAPKIGMNHFELVSQEAEALYAFQLVLVLQLRNVPNYQNLLLQTLLKNSSETCEATFSKLTTYLEEENDIFLEESEIKLNDPYSNKLMQFPVKGTECSHERAFDFLNFLSQKKN